ncbi:hypothetical protein K377_00691 [Streptomyces sp. PsTaAH-137]|nr:hypothetical protein K377_00691 [Streptomyces sp. PsTaAH-137]
MCVAASVVVTVAVCVAAPLGRSTLELPFTGALVTLGN